MNTNIFQECLKVPLLYQEFILISNYILIKGHFNVFLKLEQGEGRYGITLLYLLA